MGTQKIKFCRPVLLPSKTKNKVRIYKNYSVMLKFYI